MKQIFYLITCVSFLIACNDKSNKIPVDLIVNNAVIYTIDSSFSIAEAMAIKDGKIIATGTAANILSHYQPKRLLDAAGKFIYPGLIDAHTHFYRYGLGLQTANLVGTHSWEEILIKIKSFAAESKDGWLTGRGWDQNNWTVKEFPSNEELNMLFPDRPVILTRIDGHAAIANQNALSLAGIKAGDKLTGGQIEVRDGELTGILIDNAVDLVRRHMPTPSIELKKESLLDAQRNCFAVGLTTVDDCGLNVADITFIDSMQKTGELKMRVYAMLGDSKRNYDYIFKHGKIKTPFLNVSSFKVYADGALGSRGACLLQPYTDKPEWQGFLLSSPAHFDSVAALLYKKGYQMCTHAIGDSGNRVILDIYSKYLKGKNDLRWRIEHAQVINKNDINKFGQFSIVPSVQPTHATSDMYWARDRLGSDRVNGAYAYKQLMDQNGWIPLGTDFPVEDISPFKTFYAAVVRKDAKGWPEPGFQMENALTRENALRGMTIWAAKANFEENEKGSLEKGKYADFIVLDKDLMKVEGTAILSTIVFMTYINGYKVFERK